ncbi:MAG: hypothetical protein AAGJ85_02475 [Pseudomonadota bacterium]
MSDDNAQQETSAQPAAGLVAPTKADMEALSKNIVAVINARFREHSQWMQQWYNWANTVMMQMQPIPPQAIMDFDMQSQGLIAFVQSFKPSAKIFEANGYPQLSTLINNTEEGARKTQEAFQAAQKKMATDNFNTQQKIWEMNKQTNQQILGMQQDIHRNRVDSFDRSNKAFLDYLRS